MYTLNESTKRALKHSQPVTEAISFIKYVPVELNKPHMKQFNRFMVVVEELALAFSILSRGGRCGSGFHNGLVNIKGEYGMVWV